MTVLDTLSAEELLAVAQRERNGRVRCRLLAIRHLRRGYGIEETAGVFGLGRSQLYQWLHRYNTEGLAGLVDQSRSGCPPRLAREQEADFLSRLQEGPSAEAGLAAWRGEDIRQLLKEAFHAEYSLAGTYALLHRLKQSNLVPRPHHPEADPAAAAAFKKSAAR
jgi:transposase